MNYAFPLIAAFLWGGNTLVSKLAAGAIPPGEIAFLRWLIAVIILLPLSIAPLMRHRHLVLNNIGKLATLGILGGVVFQSLAYNAAVYTSAVNMGVIQALVPLLTIILASLMLRSWPGYSIFVGALISLSGVIIVISHGSVSQLVEHGMNKGDGMMLIAALSMATYNVLLKRWHINTPILVSLFCQAVAAMLVLLPFYLIADKQLPTLATSAMIGYAAIGASILAPLTWMIGSHHLGPARVSLFFNLVPIVTAALAVLLLAEPLTSSLLVGGLLTLAGVALVELVRLRGPAVRAVSTPI